MYKRQDYTCDHWVLDGKGSCAEWAAVGSNDYFLDTIGGASGILAQFEALRVENECPDVPASAEDGDDGNAADDADRHPGVVGEDGAQPQAERADGGSEGSWVGADGICTFQRLPSAGGGGGDGRAVLWRELDLDGTGTTLVKQVRLHTALV